MYKTITYKKSLSGKLERKQKEFFLFRKGWEVYSEEDVKQFSAGKGFLLALLFLPLVLFGGQNKIKVTYYKK